MKEHPPQIDIWRRKFWKRRVFQCKCKDVVCHVDCSECTPDTWDTMRTRYKGHKRKEMIQHCHMKYPNI